MGVRGYLASLPERTARAAVALTGGAVLEASQVALPRIVRGSRLYQATVARLLRIMVELVGGVRGVYPAEAMSVRELTTRKAAGNVVELASILAVGWSPLWWLAAASDVAGGSKAYLKTLVGELEQSGVLKGGTDVSSYEDLLSRLETGSGVLADAVDVPPLKLADARASWETLQGQAENLPSPDDLSGLYEQLQTAAKRDGSSIAEVSAAVGLAAARAGVELGNVHVVDYYRDALNAIVDEGLLRFLRRAAAPYARQAGAHFDPRATTYTDRLLAWAGPRLPWAEDAAPPQRGQGAPDGPSPAVVIASGTSERSPAGPIGADVRDGNAAPPGVG